MLVKCNLHTHSTFCDGKNTPEQMVLSAIEKGFETLGFSSHSPLPTGENYFLKDLDGYNCEIERLKEKYKNQITILKGLEVDYYCNIPVTDFDYIIGSVHYIKIGEKYWGIDCGVEEFCQALNEVFNGDIYLMIQAYYDLVYQMIEKYNPTIVGHFDLISIYNRNNKFFDESDEKYLSIVRKTLEKLKGKKLLFEINLSSKFKKLKDEAYPCNAILKMILDFGFDVILSSDAHTVDMLGFAFDEGISTLKTIGFKKIKTFYKNSFLYLDI